MPPKVAAAKKKKAPAAVAVASQKEKRQKRYRTSCSAAVRQRIERAKTQRLFLVQAPQQNSIIDNNNNNNNNNTNVPNKNETTDLEFAVMGSTGNIYTVVLSHLVSCSCPDHAKGNVCKHILFVMLKVIGLSDACPLIYQTALVTSELKEIAMQLQQRMAYVGRNHNNNTFLANDRVRKAYNELTSPNSKTPINDTNNDDNDGSVKRQTAEGEDCPICFDPLLLSSGKDERLVYCRAMCGANFHAACIETWKRQQSTCPNCRSEWQDDAAAAGAAAANNRSPEGYTNLGRLQGQSPQRDTSTYSEWYGYHSSAGNNKRRRRR